MTPAPSISFETQSGEEKSLNIAQHNQDNAQLKLYDLISAFSYYYS